MNQLVQYLCPSHTCELTILKDHNDIYFAGLLSEEFRAGIGGATGGEKNCQNHVNFTSS